MVVGAETLGGGVVSGGEVDYLQALNLSNEDGGDTAGQSLGNPYVEYEVYVAADGIYELDLVAARYNAAQDAVFVSVTTATSVNDTQNNANSNGTLTIDNIAAGDFASYDAGLWNLSKGTNTIRISMTDSGVAIDSLTLKRNDVTADGVSAQTMQYIYDIVGNELAMLDASGAQTTYEYDNLYRLKKIIESEVTDPNNVGLTVQPTTLFDYDLLGRLEKVTDARGHNTLYGYDDLDRMISLTLPDADGVSPNPNTDQPVFAYDYDSLGNLLQTTDSLTYVTQYQYDDLYRMTKLTETDPDGTLPTYESLKTVFGYDLAGQLKTVTEDSTRVTLYDYDGQGRTIKVTLPDPDTNAAATGDIPDFEYEYDALGNLMKYTDARDNVTAYAYDDLYRMTTLTEADPDGALTVETSPVTTCKYDLVGQLESVTDAENRKTEYLYDQLGRTIQTTLPDPDNGGANTTDQPIYNYTYDRRGNLIVETDPLQNRTQYAYDNLYRLTREIAEDPDGPGKLAHPITAYLYDETSNLLSLTDPVGNKTSYTLDNLDRVTAETITLDDVDFSRSYKYDTMGNLTERTDRNGRVSRYEYDNLHRMTQETWIDDDNSTVNHTISYDFDNHGNLTEAEDLDDGTSVSKYNYAYDDLDRVTTIDVDYGNASFYTQLAQTYDKNSNRRTLTAKFDKDGSAATNGYADDFKNIYTYDALNRITRITQGSQSLGNRVDHKSVIFTYNQVGQFDTIIRNGFGANPYYYSLESTYTYDGLGRLTELEHEDVISSYSIRTVVAKYNMTYDRASRLDNLTTTAYDAASTDTTNYDYDKTNQLTVDGDNDFAYDENGNRTQQDSGDTVRETAWWSFDDSSADDLISTNDGIISGATFADDLPAAAGGQGKSLSLDGDSQQVKILDNDELEIIGDDFAISIWFKPATGNTYSAILGKGNPWVSGGKGYDLWYYNNSSNKIVRLRLNDGNGAVQSVDIPEPTAGWQDQWYHYVAVVENTSGGEINVYLDGSLQHTATNSQTGDLNSTYDMVLGNFNDGSNPTYGFEGQIDDLRIFHQSLDAADAIALSQSSAALDTDDRGRETSRWTFDDSLANVTDTDNDAVMPGGTADPAYDTDLPTIANGVGKSLSFDGVDDKITIPDHAGLEIKGDNFAISFWFKPVTGNTYSAILGKGNPYSTNGRGYDLFFFENGGNKKLQFRLNNGSGSSQTVSIPTPEGLLDEWHHFTAVVENTTGGEIILYLDGMEKQRVANQQVGATANALDSTYDMVVGNFGLGTNSAYFFKGKIDDLRVFHEKLASADVVALYQTNEALQPGLAFYETGEYNRIIFDGTNAYLHDAEGNRTRRINLETGVITQYVWDYRNRLTEINTGDVVDTSFWSLDDETAYAENLVGFHATGLLMGDAQYVSAGVDASKIHSDTVLDLDGTGDYVKIGDYENLKINDGRLTVGGWFKFGTGQGTAAQLLFGQGKPWGSSGEGYDLNYVDTGDGRLTLRIMDENQNVPATALVYNAPSGSELNDGEWHHLAIVFDRTIDSVGTNDIQLYVDGDSKVTVSHALGTIGGTKYFSIGSVGGGATNTSTFLGQIDQVRVFPRALAAGEVTFIRDFTEPIIDRTQGVQYTYDPFDRRIKKEIDTDGNGLFTDAVDEAHQYIYDGGDIVLAFDGANNLTNRYLHGPAVDQILADEQYGADTLHDDPATEEGIVYWTLTDHQGSVRDLVTYDWDDFTSGWPHITHIEYDAFGNITSETDPTGAAHTQGDSTYVSHIYGFTGRERDYESDLQYNRARYYDAAIGSWISADPIAFAAGDANLYRYVGNGPTNWRDPSGLDFHEDFESSSSYDPLSIPPYDPTEDPFNPNYIPNPLLDETPPTWPETDLLGNDLTTPDLVAPRKEYRKVGKIYDKQLDLYVYIWTDGETTDVRGKDGELQRWNSKYRCWESADPDVITLYPTEPPALDLALDGIGYIVGWGILKKLDQLNDIRKKMERADSLNDKRKQAEKLKKAEETADAAKNTCFVAGTEVVMASGMEAGPTDDKWARLSFAVGVAMVGIAGSIVHERRRKREQDLQQDRVRSPNANAKKTKTPASGPPLPNRRSIDCDTTKSERVEADLNGTEASIELASDIRTDQASVSIQPSNECGGVIVTPTESPARKRTIGKSVSRIAGAMWLAGCLLLAGWLCFGTASVPTTDSTNHASLASLTESTLVTKNIEDIQVGERVVADTSRGDGDTSLGLKVEPAKWRKITLRAPKKDGSWSDIVLLRPLSWFEDQSISVEKGVHIVVPECGIDSIAEVLAIEPCPAIQAGSGRVVTGTFKHAAASILSVFIEGTAESIDATPNHRFWSEDRQNYVRADELQTGERLRTLDGIRRITKLVENVGTKPVYNLEIHVDHVYHVGSGVLVHNAGKCPKPKNPATSENPLQPDLSGGKRTPQNPAPKDTYPKIDQIEKSKNRNKNALKGGDEDALDRAARNEDTIRKRQARRRQQERQFRNGKEFE